MSDTYVLELQFAPGTKDALVGKLLAHSISSFQEGDAGGELSADGTVLNENTKLTCFFESSAAAENIRSMVFAEFGAAVAASLSAIPSADWQNAWKEFAVPIEISPRLLICPSFTEPPARPGQKVLVIDPELAFGSGSHQTTKLCLTLIDEILAAQPVKKFLDVGCGSGILAIAAAKLGAGKVIGIDLSDEIIATAAKNARTNTADCIFSAQPLAEAAAVCGKFDLIAANILSSALKLLWPDILRAAAPGARIILSGILASEETEFARALALSGYRKNSAPSEDGDSWIALEIVCPFTANL